MSALHPQLSGDRVPGMSAVAPRLLALHRLISEEQAERAIERGKGRRPALFPVEKTLPLTLQALQDSFSLSGRDFLEHCCRFIGVGPFAPPGLRRHFTVSALLSDLAWCLLDEDDEEGCVVTASLFARIISDDDRELLPMDFLAAVVRAYVDHTRYLLPLLHRYARTAWDWAATHGSDDVFLFLRDGLCFWPAFLALQHRHQSPQPMLRHLIYTRPLRQHRLAPLVTTGDGADCVVEPLRPIARGTLLDVGLYGTLIQSLHDTGFLQRDNGVLFFGSRNPHIAGFMNQQTQQGTPTSVQEVISMVDTIECLMKPIQLVTQTDEGSRVLLRLGDPLSFICAAALMRELYHYRDDDQAPARGEWYLKEPIPAWKDASDFIARFHVPSCMPPSTFVVRAE
jgi:hypothetical protein